jgi:spore coat protein U-like protein
MRRKAAIVAGLALASAGLAHAASQLEVPFQARVTIQTSCSVDAANLDFGAVGVIAAQTATAPVTIHCSAGTPYTLSFSDSASVTSYNSVMVNGANSVAYSAALTGSGGTGPGAVLITGVLLPQSTPPSGIYTDNRTVYLDY